MKMFLVQLGHELRRMAARPRSWFGFAASVVFVVVTSVLLRIEPVRLLIARDLWKMRWKFDEAFSGLTTATHLLGEAAAVLASLGIALTVCETVAREADDGTLRMTFCRPVSRGRWFAQKLLVCALYTLAITFFTGACALLAGLFAEGRGPLVLIAPHEEVIGTFEFGEGLQRYGIALLLLNLTTLSGMTVVFALSCFDLRPATAAAVALSFLLIDTVVRTTPQFAPARPWCVTTRLLAWRQVFNDPIPQARIQRAYTELAIGDAVFLATAWLGFRRRDFKP